MENAIIIRTDLNFKSPELTKATNAIASTMAKLSSVGEKYKEAYAKAQKEVAKTLYEVGKGKYYKVDGFKSLAEYGETIGLEKSTVHKLENAGRVLCSTNEEVAKMAADMDYSKLAILSSADPVKLNDAISKGEVKAEMTSEEVKEWKARNTASKPKIEKRMDYKGVIYTTNSDGTQAEPINYANSLKDELPFINDYSWTFYKANETRIEVGINLEKLLQGQLEMAWYVASPVVKTNTSNAKPVMDAEAIKKAIANLPEEVRKALLASME